MEWEMDDWVKKAKVYHELGDSYYWLEWAAITTLRLFIIVNIDKINNLIIDIFVNYSGYFELLTF